jgi:hypothetical protein
MWKRVKHGGRGRVARFRVPGGAAPAAAEDATPAEPGYDDRPLPLAASILWRPVDGEPGQGPGILPTFVAQRALVALQEHCATTPAPCFGLLTGNLFRSPETAAPYLVIGSTIRLPGAVGLDAKAALLEGSVVAQEVVRKTGDQVVGWYRGGGGEGPRESDEVGLTPAEVEIHGAMFGQAWQVAVTICSADGTALKGGVFRRSANDGWNRECLPFYELLDPATVQPDGGKPTRLTWTNYRADETALIHPPAAPLPVPSAGGPPAPLAPRAPARVSARVLMPDQFVADDDAHGLAPATAATLRSVGRMAGYGSVAVLAAIGLFRVFGAFVSPPAPTPSPVAPAVTLATPHEGLDRAADTLALAIAAFDLRTQLFASRQMQCPELARGLVLVEERWTLYNAERKTAGVALDSARTARDRALYADADAVERRFERSHCARP